jgi:hypothetical protein
MSRHGRALPGPAKRFDHHSQPHNLARMEAFEALSFADKWRTSRFVFHGRAPQDPRMAAAAVELAERYQQHSWARWVRLLLPVVIIASLAAAIQGAVNGDPILALSSGLVAVTNLAQFALNPATRPKNVERSLEASRRIAAQLPAEPGAPTQNHLSALTRKRRSHRWRR